MGDTVFRWLVDQPTWKPVAFLWEHPRLGDMPTQLREQVEHARIFSEVMHGAALLYNLLLAEGCEERQRGQADKVPVYRERLAAWVQAMHLRAAPPLHGSARRTRTRGSRWRQGVAARALRGAVRGLRSSRRAVTDDDRRERAQVIGELRAVLAMTCVDALEPDLVILDEFQRFKRLLVGDDDASKLARELFRYKDVKLLLLSATPYKMYTSAAEEENHYDDFLATVKFLEGANPPAEPLPRLLERYRDAVYSVKADGGIEQIEAAANELGARLSRVMARTERLGASTDRNGMLRSVDAAGLAIGERDVRSYAALQRVGRELDQNDLLEFWKSAPYLLNFMDDYELKRAFKGAIEDDTANAALARNLEPSPDLLLRWEDVRKYCAIDPGNARLRALRDMTIGREAWRLLWIPGRPCSAPPRPRATAPAPISCPTGSTPSRVATTSSASCSRCR